MTNRMHASQQTLCPLNACHYEKKTLTGHSKNQLLKSVTFKNM